MKIGVIGNSRGRSNILYSSLTALETLSSKEHEIHYCIRVDDDDPASLDAVHNFGRDCPNAAYLSGARLATLGEGANQAIKFLPECDAYTVWHTATFPLTIGWDAAIAHSAKTNPGGVYWWRAPGNDGPTLWAFDQLWYDALGWVYTEHFPFWFDDTWLAELDLFVNGGPLRSHGAFFSQRRDGKTHRLRDLHFWYNFFFLTRKIRVDQAKVLCAKLGKTFNDPAGLVAHLEAGDKETWPQIERIQKQFGSDPAWEGDEQYFATKKKADSFLQKHFGPRVDDLSEWPLNFGTVA